MSNATVSAYTSPQPRLPTPSPYSTSIASTRWSSRPPIQVINLVLRFLALVLAFGSALSLAAISPRNSKLKNQSSRFCSYPGLLYCFSVNILSFLYAAYQLFKCICDISHRGIFISDMISDHISFIFDQLAGYLLISSSSVAVPVIQQMENGNSLKKAAIVSISMSFASFLIIAANALLSGYKFCKRIIW
ncbi:CASP-like protein 4A4 [Primulina huaijiensis]|uniref:CASP-like protein 4A4 n=1 Tax=Primulina huaijiensis TaxID=1492673 RepID=UPI003CC76DF7